MPRSRNVDRDCGDARRAVGVRAFLVDRDGGVPSPVDVHRQHQPGEQILRRHAAAGHPRQRGFDGVVHDLHAVLDCVETTLSRLGGCATRWVRTLGGGCVVTGQHATVLGGNAADRLGEGDDGEDRQHNDFGPEEYDLGTGGEFDPLPTDPAHRPDEEDADECRQVDVVRRLLVEQQHEVLPRKSGEVRHDHQVGDDARPATQPAERSECTHELKFVPQSGSALFM